MKLLKIVKSRKKDKKYDAVFEDDGKQKVVSFGSAGAEDYTIGELSWLGNKLKTDTKLDLLEIYNKVKAKVAEDVYFEDIKKKH